MSDKKKKYYAVICGQKPGIYASWSGENGAEVQVKGYPGSRYRAFSLLEEANAWYNNPDNPDFLQSNSASQSTQLPLSSKSQETPEFSQSNQQLGRTETTKKNNEKNNVIIYADGGCINNPGPGGYGVVLLHGDKRKELSGGYRRTTNNRMELTACIEGLKALKFPCSVTIFSDSQYVVNGITKGWARRWKSKGWMRNALEPAENADLWAQLLDLCNIHRVTFSWVKGHAGHIENERCDTLAKKAALTGENSLRDTAFETRTTTLPPAD